MIIAETIIKQCEDLCINISIEQAQNIAIYANMVIDYNKHTNITRNDSEDKMIDKNIIDSLRIIPYLPENGYVADIGCGAGFPGIIASIMTDNIIVLIDSIRKKTDFVYSVIKKLELDSVVMNDRAESIGKDMQYREQFDCVISRAAAPLNILLELSIPLLKIKGRLIAMKGSNANEEIEISQNALAILKSKIIEDISYRNRDSIERHLIIIEKEIETEEIFPRDPKKIIKKPL